MCASCQQKHAGVPGAGLPCGCKIHCHCIPDPDQNEACPCHRCQQTYNPLDVELLGHRDLPIVTIPTILVTGASASILSQLADTARRHGLRLRIIAVAFMKRTPVDPADYAHYSSSAIKAWGSRGLQMMDELCPPGAPITVQGPRRKQHGDIVAGLLDTARPWSPDKHQVHIRLRPGQPMGVRLLVQEKALDEIVDFIRQLEKAGIPHGWTVHTESRTIQATTDPRAPHHTYSVQQLLVTVHGCETEEQAKEYLAPLLNLQTTRGLGSEGNGTGVLVFAADDWNDAVVMPAAEKTLTPIIAHAILQQEITVRLA